MYPYIKGEKKNYLKYLYYPIKFNSLKLDNIKITNNNE
jgi:hypothetical protein